MTESLLFGNSTVRQILLVLFVGIFAGCASSSRVRAGSETEKNSAVYSVCFNADGTILAAGGRAAKIQVWEVAQLKLAKTIVSEGSQVGSVRFAPLTGQLVSGSDDGTVVFWNPRDFTKLRSVKTGIGAVYAIACSADGKIIAASGNRMIELLDGETGKEIGRIEAHDSEVFSVVFSQDGKSLASGGWDGKLQIWDVPTRKNITTFRGSEAIYCVHFSPDRKVVASGNYAGAIEFWDLRTSKKLAAIDAHHKNTNVCCLASNGRVLASASGDHTIKLWDWKTRKCLATLRAHTAPVWSLAFSTNGKTLASGSADGTVRLWEVGDGTEIATMHSDGRVDTRAK